MARIFTKMFSQLNLDLDGKPLLDIIYDEKTRTVKRDLFNLKPGDDINKELNKIKFHKNGFPEVMLNTLKDLLNFMFGVQSEFFEKNRFPLTLYLIYLSFGIIKKDID